MTPADLKAARLRLALSQAQLAARLGVDVITVSRWERGVQAIPPYLGIALAHLEQQAREQIEQKEPKP